MWERGVAMYRTRLDRENEPGVKKVSRSVIRRLPVYLRVLDNLIGNDVEVISSRELSERTGFTAEQIRKDLAHFGAFGTKGTGYNTEALRSEILKIIGLHEKTAVIVVGAGHLGTALTRYNVNKNPYTHVVAAFDTSPEVVGDKILDVEVLHVSEMEEVVSKHNVRVAILAVPSEHAQAAADQVAGSGVKVIFNFAPLWVRAPDGVFVHNADLSVELQSLIYYATKEREKAH